VRQSNISFTVLLSLYIDNCLNRDEVNQVVHSNDAFAPVAYLNLCKMHLEEKAVDEQVCFRFMQLVI